MPSAGKRGPAALVTDVRERSDHSGPQRQSQAQAQAAHQTRNAMRFMTVDNILQYASDIPSARPRHSPTPSPTPQRTAFSPAPASHPSASPSASSMSSVSSSSSSSSSASASPAPHNYNQPQRKPHFGAGGGLPNAPSRAGQAMPSRTTKISEKLVLLPEADTPSDDGDDGDGDDGDGDDDAGRYSDRDDDAGDETGPPPSDRDRPGSPPTGLYQLQPKHADDPIKRRLAAEMEAGHAAGLGRPVRNEELDVLRKRGGIRGKSYAERLPKPRRAEEKVSRVTAYCTAEAFKTKDVAEFLRLRHEAKTKLYDDCLYTIYSLPLLQGTDGFRLRSRPMLRTPGLSGKTVLDLEIEQSEQRDHHEGYFDEYSFGGGGGSVAGTAGYRSSTEGGGSEYRSSTERDGGGGGGHDGGNRHGALGDGLGDDRAGAATGEDGVAALRSPVSPINRLAPEAKNFAEMFVLSYGVVVFWNFTEAQEKDILADLAFAANKHHHHHYHHHHHHLPHNHHPPHQHRSSPSSALVARPLPQENVETEEFHFEYSSEIARPRIFNDMITLLPRSDHMVKLTISHAIAQSTKLCFFEERMAETILSAQHVPKTMALTGQLNMERKEVLKMMGRLFKNRVEINLSSNILDVPNFFWDSEPTLHPLYGAIRDYLEIDLRIRVLNERCRVFLDLSAILSDSVADSKMNLITWIIIVLIVVSIVIEVTEVILRTAIIKRGTATDPLPPPGPGQQPRATAGLMARGLGLPEGVGIEDLRRWSALLAEEDHTYVCGESIVDRRAGLRPEY